jgi:hypothetical protein
MWRMCGVLAIVNAALYAVFLMPANLVLSVLYLFVMLSTMLTWRTYR